MCLGRCLGERDWYVLGKVLRGERLGGAWGEITGRDLGCA